MEPIEIDSHPHRWVPEPAAEERKVALIVGTDEGLMALPQALAAVEDLEPSLRRMGFEVHTLTGERVTANRVRNVLRSSTEGLTGAGNQLLVMWIGHGVVRDDVRRLATSETVLESTTGEDGRVRTHWSQDLSYDSLYEWIATIKEELRERGGQLETAVVLDACANEQGTPPAIPLEPVVGIDFELFASTQGNFAYVDAELQRPALSGHLTAAMENAWRGGQGRVGLLACLRVAKERSETLARQLPEAVFAQPREGVLPEFQLYSPGNLGLTLEVLDAEHEAPLENVVAVLNGQALEGAGTLRFRGLARNPDGYTLTVRRDGYFPFSIPIDSIDRGERLVVKLTPAFMALEGAVRFTGDESSAVSVRAEGLTAVHSGLQLSTNVLGSKRFRLYLPHDAEACQLVFEMDGNRVLERDVSLRLHATMETVMDPDLGLTHVPVRVIPETLMRAGGGLGGLRRGGFIADEGSFSPRVDRLAPGDFIANRGASLFSQMERGRWNEAYDELGRNREFLKPEAVERSAALQRELLVAWRLEQYATAVEEAGHERMTGDVLAARTGVDDCLDRLINSAALDVDEVRPRMVLWLEQSAQEWMSLGEYPRAFQRLEDLRRPEAGFDRALLANLRRGLLLAWMQDDYQDGIQNGTWEVARERTALLADHGLEKDAATWLELIERENISPACRSEMSHAMEAVVGGRLEAGLTHFYAALDARPNAYHRARILEEVQRLRRMLYERNYQLGMERAEEGEVGAALEGYSRALAFESQAAGAIERLLAQSPDLRRSHSKLCAAFVDGKEWRSVEARVQLLLERDGQPLEAAAVLKTATGEFVPHGRLMVAWCTTLHVAGADSEQVMQQYEAGVLLEQTWGELRAGRLRAAQVQLDLLGSHAGVTTRDLRPLETRLETLQREAEAEQLIEQIGQALSRRAPAAAAAHLEELEAHPARASAQLPQLRATVALAHRAQALEEQFTDTRRASLGEGGEFNRGLVDELQSAAERLVQDLRPYAGQPGPSRDRREEWLERLAEGGAFTTLSGRLEGFEEREAQEADLREFLARVDRVDEALGARNHEDRSLDPEGARKLVTSARNALKKLDREQRSGNDYEEYLDLLEAECWWLQTRQAKTYKEKDRLYGKAKRILEKLNRADLDAPWLVERVGAPGKVPVQYYLIQATMLDGLISERKSTLDRAERLFESFEEEFGHEHYRPFGNADLVKKMTPYIQSIVQKWNKLFGGR